MQGMMGGLGERETKYLGEEKLFEAGSRVLESHCCLQKPMEFYS